MSTTQSGFVLRESTVESGIPLTSEYFTYYPTWTTGVEQQTGLVGERQSIKVRTPITGVTGISGVAGLTGVRGGITGGLVRPVEDVVITGVSGRFPGCETVEEFAQKLYNGVEVVGERCLKTGLLSGVPKRFGSGELIGVTPSQYEVMDPQVKVLLEVAYEAIFDSGLNPVELKGSRTGVFIGTNTSETMVHDDVTGLISTMLANRLSYHYELKGPSYTFDSVPSTSLVGLDLALNAIKSGQCEYALVGAINFLKNVVAPVEVVGEVPFTVSVILLQKRSTCRRFYAKVLHSKVFTDVLQREQGIMTECSDIQTRLLKEVYGECNIDPSLVTYVESHLPGQGPIVPQELAPISEVFVSPRVQRNVPLFVGTTKSFKGYQEQGICALVKMLISIQRGVIPANLQYQEPIVGNWPSLVDGRLRIVNGNTKFHGGLMALSSFGLGGVYSHVLLQPNSEYIMTKLGNSSLWNQPELVEIQRLPRLFPFCGRTQQGVERVIEHIRRVPTDLAAQALLQPNAVSPVLTHPYRGFTVLNGKQVIQEVRKVEVTEPRPVWYVFNGIGAEWQGMGQEFMTLDVFRQSILKSVEVLRPYGINLMDLIYGKQKLVENTLNSFVGVTAIQIALVDCLRHIGVQPEGWIGHSIGELACAYVDNCLTAEEALLTAYHRGRCIEEVQLPLGAMATVGLTWEEVKRRCPVGVVPAIHNSVDTVIVSGPRQVVVEFVEQLKSEGIFAKEIESRVAYHSQYMTKVAPQLRYALEKVIMKPRQRSARWISTSVPEQLWSTEMGRLSSPEYFVNNLVSPVLFQESLRHIPSNAIVVEVGPHALLQSVLRRSLAQQIPVIPLISKEVVYPLENFLTQLGRLYVEGVNVDALKLVVPYGREQTIYPVPVQTGFLSHLIRGDHVPTWTTPIETGVCGVEKVLVPVTYKYNVDLIEDAYLTGHQIDGRILYPTTGYLYLIWKSLAQLKGYQTVEQVPISFENVEFHRCTVLPTTGLPVNRLVESVVVPKKVVEFVVRIVPKTGVFELVEGCNVIVSGRVTVPETVGLVVPQQPTFTLTGRQLLEQEEIYRQLRTRGYEYQGEFQPILRADVEGTCGELLWTGKWVPFLESMLQMNVFGQKRGLLLPTRIRSIRINPTVHLQTPRLRVVRPELVGLVGCGVERQCGVLPVVFDPLTNTTVCGGIEINGLHTIVTPRRQLTGGVYGVEGINFVPYYERPVFDDEYVVVDKMVSKEGEYVPEYGVWNPLVESGVRQNREFVEYYLGECRRYVQHILRKIEQPTIGIQTIVPTVLPLGLEQQFESLKLAELKQQLPTFVQQGQLPIYTELLEGGKLLQLLTRVANVDSTDGQYLIKVQKFFNDKFAYLKAIEEDSVLNFATNKCFYLKNILDTILENTQLQRLERLVELREQMPSMVQPKLRILEISPSVSQFLGCKVHNLVKVFPKFAGEFEYHYVQPTFGEQVLGTVQPEEYFEELTRQVPFPIRKVEWNIISRNGQLVTEVPSYLREYDLVILNGGLSSLLPVVGGNEYELKKWLQVVMDKVVRPQGFLFVNEYTNNVDFLQQLVRLEQIALSRQPVPLTVYPLWQQKLQSEIEWRRLIEQIGLYPVSLKSDIGLSSMYLYRKPLTTTRQVVIGQNGVVVGEEKVLIDTLDQFSWINKVKVAMLDKQVERVWIVSEKVPTVGVVGLINGLRREFGGEKIRCVFVADKQPIVIGGRQFPVVPIVQEQIAVPKVVEWTELFDQIRKVDLVMNVFRNGQWGSYRQVVEPTLVEKLLSGGRQLPLYYWQQPHLQTPFIRQQLKKIYGTLPVVPFETQYPVEYPTYYGRQSFVPFYGEQYPVGQQWGRQSPVFEPEIQQLFGLKSNVCFNPIQTYVITGGLAGFGLELAHWMVERGARRIVITSKVGVRTEYQVRKLRILRDEFNAQIQVLPLDVKQEVECLTLIKEAAQMSIENRIGGIFHLSGIWEELPYEIQQQMQQHQIQQQIRKLYEGVKCVGTLNLDKYVRSECVMDESAYFVVFVPTFGTRTTVMPTPYTTIEKICELRRREGKHVLCVQWGFNTELGLTHDYLFGGEYETTTMPLTTGVTLPKRILPCLRVLESLLVKSWEPKEMYTTYIPIEKILNVPEMCQLPGTFVQQQQQQQRSLIEVVLGVLGVKDIKTVICNEQITLGELGLDSTMCVEIKKIFEQVYNLPFTPKEIQELTIEKIRSIEMCQQPTRILPTTSFTSCTGVYPTGVYPTGVYPTGVYPTGVYQTGVFPTGVYPTGVYPTGVYPTVGVSSVPLSTVVPRMYTTKKVNYLMPSRIVERLNQIEMTPQQVPIVVIHPIEGHVNMLRSWAKQMKYPVFGVQFTQEAMQCETVEQLAEFYWTQIEREVLRQVTGGVVPRIHLCGYSFGASVAYEMAQRRNARIASLTFLDGCHSYVNGQLSLFRNRFPMVELTERMHEVESEILYTFLQQYVPTMVTKREFVEELIRLPSLEQRIRYVVRELLTKSQFQFEQVDLEIAARSYLNKILMAIKYQPKQFLKFPEVLLIKSTGPINVFQQYYGQDYGLGKVFGGKVQIECVEGDHRSFLEGINAHQVANILNNYYVRCF